jgi:two-component system chemotaxis response regulator CheY
MFHLRTRILVVDDMMAMRTIVKTVCGGIGFYQVDEVDNVDTAWNLMNEAKPAIGLIICDFNMPGKNGMEFLKMVRGDTRFASVPFIMMTVETEQKHVIDAIKAGVSDYIKKPFTGELLKAALERTHKKMAKTLGA